MNELDVKENGVYCGFPTEMVIIDFKGKTIIKEDIDDMNTIDLNVNINNNISL